MSDWHVGQIVKRTGWRGEWLMRVLELNDNGVPSIGIDVDRDGKIINLEARHIASVSHVEPLVTGKEGSSNG